MSHYGHKPRSPLSIALELYISILLSYNFIVISLSLSLSQYVQSVSNQLYHCFVWSRLESIFWKFLWPGACSKFGTAWDFFKLLMLQMWRYEKRSVVNSKFIANELSESRSLTGPLSRSHEIWYACSSSPLSEVLFGRWKKHSSSPSSTLPASSCLWPWEDPSLYVVSRVTHDDPPFQIKASPLRTLKNRIF